MTTANKNPDIITVDEGADARILDRIHKLLTLAEHETSNVGEAGNAAAKVQELLDAHNLELAQVRARAGEQSIEVSPVVELRHTYGPYTSALNKGWQQLMSVVARQHHCSIILVRGWEAVTPEERKRRKGARKYDTKKEVAQFAVIGQQVNAETTTTVFDWLKQQLEIEATREWPPYRAEREAMGYAPGDPIPFRVNFIMGAAREINRIMKERREANENFQAVTALAINHREANENYKNEKYPNLRTGSSSKSQGNYDAFARGRDAGGRVERARSTGLGGGGRPALR